MDMAHGFHSLDGGVSKAENPIIGMRRVFCSLGIGD